MHFGGFQAFGGVPGEGFDMQNPNLRSKVANSVAQRPKNEKNELSIVIRGFLVITRTPFLVGRDWAGIFPRSLPQLSKQRRDQHNSPKTQKTNGLSVLGGVHDR